MGRDRYGHCRACDCNTCRGWTSNPDRLPETQCRCLPCLQVLWEAAWNARQSAPATMSVERYESLLARERDARKAFQAATERQAGVA